MTIPETLEAGPITLHRWTPDLAGDLHRAVLESLPELVRFMHWATGDYDLDAARGYLRLSHGEWDSGETFNFAMLTPQREVVGSCGLMSRRGPTVYEIGYWVHSAYAGRGYATAVAQVLAEAGLGEAGIDRVEIHHDLDNPASGRVAAKAGFREVGRLRVDKKALCDPGTHLVWARTPPKRG